MEKVIADYLAKKILEDLRNGIAIDSALAAVIVNKMDLVEKIRSMIDSNDFQILKKLIDMPDFNLVRLGIILLQPLQGKNSQIQQLLLDKWNSTAWASPQAEFNVKLELMFRLLDDPNLELKVQESIYDYVLRNHKEWLTAALEYFPFEGDYDKLKELIENKLKDQRFPPTKSWLYLLILNAHPDKSKIKGILSKYATSMHPMVKRVADDLLK